MVTEAGRACGARTLAIAYRLAPENPFPAALDDALGAWRFLRNSGVDAQKIVVGGDSAGGGLTLALLQHLRDAGEELPACAWIVSPWTDLTLSGATLLSKDSADPIIHKPYLEELAQAYVPFGMDRKDPRLIQVGSEETLLDDAVRFAGAAGAAQVAANLEIWPQMIHAWPMWNAHLQAGRDALSHAGAFIGLHIAR
jgi:acetyl esterase/lipase